MSSSNNQDKLSAILAAFWEEISSKVDAYAIPSIQRHIEDWVGKEPALTEALCKYVVQYASSIKEDSAESTVDEIVRKEILRDWESSLAAAHLRSVQDAVLSPDRQDSVLIAYIQILQRGEVARLDESPEQTVLLESGLVKVENGRLRVANALYAAVFDLDWVEQQIPGITKPVTIVTPQRARNAPSEATKLYSKVAIAACGLAVVGAAISSYIRESGGEAQAIPEGVEAESALVETAPSAAVSRSAPTETVEKASPEASGTDDAIEKTQAPAAQVPADVEPEEVSAKASDRERFDRGEDHAKNSRWVLMMRDFCGISPESVYFASAQKDLVRWNALYPEDLKIAVDVVSAEQGDRCAIAETPLDE